MEYLFQYLHEQMYKIHHIRKFKNHFNNTQSYIYQDDIIIQLYYDLNHIHHPQDNLYHLHKNHILKIKYLIFFFIGIKINFISIFIFFQNNTYIETIMDSFFYHSHYDKIYNVFYYAQEHHPSIIESIQLISY